MSYILNIQVNISSYQNNLICKDVLKEQKPICLEIALFLFFTMQLM